MKPRLVFVITAITLMLGAALLAQPPAGMRDRGQRFENMLTRSLSLNATQQGQVHTILADAQVQSSAIRDQLKPLRTSLLAAIKANDSAQIESLHQQISPLQQQLDVIHSKAAAQIYAALSPDQQTKVGNAIGMLMGGGFGPGMRRGGGPPKQ
ncbi:MAG TPA: periplasmic heavy metal sensor [Bryobacteraceae bacterium]|jgi:Spy/CpxP family protein refolding chaperone|nr:periplasmic heavy metal sensor [Bryobacteraceae bacterium]